MPLFEINEANECVCEVAHVSMCTAAAQGSLQDGGSYTLLVNDNFPVEVAF